MSKIIVCCDGTSNSEFIRNNPLTNVSRIKACIVPEDNYHRRQLVYYHPGVGTDSTGVVRRYIAQGFGIGIDEQILESYAFICNNYNPAGQDQIILIGFSRGAFAVRCIADLISKKGILPRERLDILHEIYRQWRSDRPRAPDIPTGDIPGHRARITVCAVWDTVSTIGLRLTSDLRFAPSDLQFVTSDLYHSIDYAFQALALHEHRRLFFPIVMRDPGTILGPQHLEQCWFAGYHSDAGGGNARDALAHFSLIWMMSKLTPWIQFSEAGISQRIPRSLMSWGTWAVGGEASVDGPDGSYRLPVDDPAHGGLIGLLYRITGSMRRTPQSEFWGNFGVYGAGNSNMVSGEKMHAAVRFLTVLTLIEGFPSRWFPPTQNLGRWRWRWQLWPINTGPNPNIINEEALDNFQIRMLREWAQYEHRALDNLQHGPGADPPNTILVQLQDWLNDPMAN